LASSRFPVTRDVNFPHRPLAAVFANNLLDEADKGTPQFGVADLRERSDQFQSVGVGEKVGDVRGRRSRCALPDVARDLGSARCGNLNTAALRIEAAFVIARVDSRRHLTSVWQPRPEERDYSRQIGSHPGILGSWIYQQTLLLIGKGETGAPNASAKKSNNGN